MAQTILNGPIRKVIMVKVKFEDLRIFLLPGQPGSTLRKFFEFKFCRKIFLALMILNGPNRKVIMVNVKFEHLRFFYYQVILARHIEFFENFFEYLYLKKVS